MPELPEVETIARQLSKPMRGQKLTGVQVFDAKLAHAQRILAKGAVKRVFRLGKQIAIEIAIREQQRNYILVHLRMSGSLLWRRANAVQSEIEAGSVQLYFYSSTTPLTIKKKHLRLVLKFEGGELWFVDPRRFGTVQVVQEIATIESRAIDPLSGECRYEVLKPLLKASAQNIKAWLLRQDRLVGIGNIYASEILFRARVKPTRKARSLRDEETKRLIEAIRFVLERAIQFNGTTFSDYQDSRGDKGGFQNFLKVYDREGGKCRRCKGSIRRIVQQQRSTYFCSLCQR